MTAANVSPRPTVEPTARSSVRGLGAAMAARGCGTALGFALVVVIGRRLGDDALGRYAVGAAVMLVGASVARLGQDVDLTRRIAAARASSGDVPWDDVAATVRTVGRAGVVIGAAGGLLAVVLSAPASVALGACAIPAVAMVGVLAGVARGLGRPSLAIALDAVFVPAIALPLVALARTDAEALAAHAGAAAMIALAGLVVVLRPRETVSPAPLASLLSVGAPLAGLAALNIALASTDVVVVSIMRGDVDAGHYAAAARVAFISTSILAVVNAVAQPRIAALWELGRRRELGRLVRRWIAALVVVAAAVAAGLVIGARPLLGLFGPDFLAATNLLRILAIGQFVTLATGPVGAVLLMTGHGRYQLRATAVAVVVNVLADVVLIARFGVVGAAVATALALSTKNALSAWWAWRVVRSGP